jgi:hypothetical protein
LITGHYVSVTKSGRIHANGAINVNNPEKDATPIVIDRLPQRNRVRIASVKYASNSWFIVVTPEGRIRAEPPSGGNEIFEEIVLPDGFMVLRFVNYNRIISSGEEEEGSGSSLSGVGEDSGLLMPHSGTGEEATAPRRECYLGFSDETGRAQCYEDTSSANVRVHIIPHE